MLDEKWKKEFLAEIREAARLGALDAYEQISSVKINEKEWITAKEAVRDFETSPATLLRLRNELAIRKDSEWKMLRGKIVYLRKALDRVCVRRTEIKS